jgi:endonuclease/exonuclease/phosphatase family metal-dependent hydrolase
MSRGVGEIKALRIVAVTALLALSVGAVPAQAQLSKDNDDLRVMTYNVDEGTDYIEIAAAKTVIDFLRAVGTTIMQVRATDPPSRMRVVARQIIAAAPALVSLQELDQWYSGPFDPVSQQCGTLTLEYDMLQELLDALAAQGGHYEVAVQGQQYDIEAPGLLAGANICIRAVNHVAILARTDRDPVHFHNAQSQQYQHAIVFPTPLGNFTAPRAWVSVDAKFHGKEFRFIGTHLESGDKTIRRLQAGELRNGPANTFLPVIIAMDSNAPPGDLTYADFIAAGYEDVWSEIFPTQPGYTCCQAQFLDNTVSQLTSRIDLILTLGSVGAQNIALFGADPASKTPGPGRLWPSDHAGVAAQLVVEGTD